MTLTHSAIKDHVKAAGPDLEVKSNSDVLTIYDATKDRNVSIEIAPGDYDLSIEDFGKRVIEPALAALRSR